MFRPEQVVEAGLASGGFLEAAADLGWEAVPTYYAFAQVSKKTDLSQYEIHSSERNVSG